MRNKCNKYEVLLKASCRMLEIKKYIEKYFSKCRITILYNNLRISLDVSLNCHYLSIQFEKCRNMC